MSKSSEVLASLAASYYRSLPKPVDYDALVERQIAPELIQAMRALEADPGRQITGDDIASYQAWGGRDHLDPTLASSPIESERPYQQMVSAKPKR